MDNGLTLFMLWLQAIITIAVVLGAGLAWKILKRTGNGATLRLADVKRGARSESDRVRFLEFLGELKSSLEIRRRSCFFLSVDVIGSREMKTQGQGQLAYVDAFFIAYKKYISAILVSNSVWKQTWTPDGLMAAFNTVDEAAHSAKRILCGLDKFNEHHGLAGSKFKVRCGIAWGSVLMFDDSKFEAISDIAIDLAGHLQKAAPENSLLVASIAHANLHTERRGFVPHNGIVDDVTTPQRWDKSRENCESV